jgi:PhnB protein
MSAPASYPPLSPTLVVDDAAAAIDFYQKAFGAEELYRLIDPENGKIGHAESRSAVFLSCWPRNTPESRGRPDR